MMKRLIVFLVLLTLCGCSSQNIMVNPPSYDTPKIDIEDVLMNIVPMESLSFHTSVHCSTDFESSQYCHVINDQNNDKSTLMYTLEGQIQRKPQAIDLHMRYAVPFENTIYERYVLADQYGLLHFIDRGNATSSESDGYNAWRKAGEGTDITINDGFEYLDWLISLFKENQGSVELSIMEDTTELRLRIEDYISDETRNVLDHMIFLGEVLNEDSSKLLIKNNYNDYDIRLILNKENMVQSIMITYQLDILTIHYEGYVNYYEVVIKFSEANNAKVEHYPIDIWLNLD